MRAQDSGNNVVVIAEDYADISQLVGDILRDEGYNVHSVSRGADVYNAVSQLQPLVLLLDLSLPDVPGNEVLQQLSRDQATNHVPVIIVSAYTDQLRRVPQVLGVVNKPFDINTLLDEVAKVRTGERKVA